jgi:hypothetical protein
MTLPAHSSGGSFLTVFFDPMIDAWCFTGADAGPAGAVSVLLDDDVRLSVDAADPTRIVEIAVRTESEGRLAPAAVELIRVLLGASAAEFVATADPSLGASIWIEIEIEAGATIRSCAAGLAVARAAMSHRRLAHQLRGLDVVLHAHRIGHPSPAADAIRASWAVWPAAVALACACRTYPPMLTAAPSRALSALRSRLLVVLHLLAQDDPSLKHSLAYRLVDDLVQRTAAKRPDVLARVDLDTTLAALELTALDVDSHQVLEPGARNERVYMGGMVAPRPMHWSGSVEDFTARLGAELQLLHPGGITADGEAPGELRVTVPVALGVQTADLRNVRVCAVTEAGHLLGESSLAVGRDPNSLPVGIARLVLPETADGQRYERVVVDLARQEIPAPDAAELTRLDRLRAIRAGQDAVACAAAGDHGASARLWCQCADQLDSLGEHELRDQAREHAARAQAQADVEPADRAESEWLTALLSGWSRWALTEIGHIETAAESGEVASSINKLRELVDRLKGWNDPSVELARARARLGRALWAAPEHAEEPGEADYQVREAMRIFYDLGDDAAALACLRDLGSRNTRG